MTGRRERQLVLVAAAAAAALVAAEAVMLTAIVMFVPYTEIDWRAYLDQVESVIAGERNYLAIRGGTGPLVYPAGHVALYRLLFWVTNGDILPAQLIFFALYLANLVTVLALYGFALLTNTSASSSSSTFTFREQKLAVLLLLPLLCSSRRIHSLFVLRLFNDCWAVFFAHVAFLFVLEANRRRSSYLWMLALIIYSGGVSVKMNILLYAPGLLLLMLQAGGIVLAVTSIFLAALLQLAVGLPFLTAYPLEYITRSFDLGRKFIHHWSVNLKFVPEDHFSSTALSLGLLVLHLTVLGFFTSKWIRAPNLSKSNKFERFHQDKTKTACLEPLYILEVLFVSNFIGVVFARSLHYQFYTWYFFSLPYIFGKACAIKISAKPALSQVLSFTVAVILYIVIEYSFSYTFPSTPFSSATLSVSHLILLVLLYRQPLGPVYMSPGDKQD